MKHHPDKIAGFTGDLTNMETLYVAKEFFSKTIKSKYLESRINNSYINTITKKIIFLIQQLMALKILI